MARRVRQGLPSLRLRAGALRPRLPSGAGPAARHGAGTLAALLLFIGSWRAVSLAWVCDDSFISFRYAEHLIQGHGLVYNAGERVEGYSNLLWTLLVALWMRASIDPIR